MYWGFGFMNRFTYVSTLSLYSKWGKLALDFVYLRSACPLIDTVEFSSWNSASSRLLKVPRGFMVSTTVLAKVFNTKSIIIPFKTYISTRSRLQSSKLDYLSQTAIMPSCGRQFFSETAEICHLAEGRRERRHRHGSRRRPEWCHLAERRRQSLRRQPSRRRPEWLLVTREECGNTKAHKKQPFSLSGRESRRLEEMEKTSKVICGDSGLVDTQLGCEFYDLAFIPAWSWLFCVLADAHSALLLNEHRLS